MDINTIAAMINSNFITFTLLYLRVYKSENELEHGLRG
jgi:hypothetical protein